MIRFFVIFFIIFIPLIGDDINIESKRTVVMDHDQELEDLFYEMKELSDVQKKRSLVRMIRVGKDKLIRLKDRSDSIYYNARDLAIEQLLKYKFEKNRRAVKLLERSGEDWQKKIKILERYPFSLTAREVAREWIRINKSGDNYFEWKPYIDAVSDKKVTIQKEKIYLPASEKHSLDLSFEIGKSFDILFQGSIFPQILHRESFRRSEDIIRPYFPLDFFDFDQNGITTSDFRGITRFTLEDPIKQYSHHLKPTLLDHLDNNIIGDLTVYDDQLILTSQRHTPLKKDTQKDLYIVELSRHQINCFDISKGVHLAPNKKRTYIWSPSWSLNDPRKSFNSSVVIRGQRGYTTSTTLSGLFNTELVSFDIKTGSIKWRRTLSSGQQELNYFGRYIREAVSGVPLVTDEYIYVSSNFGTIHCLDLYGRPIWTTRYNRVPTPTPIQYYARVNPRLSKFRNQMPRLYGDYVYVSPTDSDDFLCVDRKNGEIIWKHSLNQSKNKQYPHAHFWRKVFWFVAEEGVTFIDRDKITMFDRMTGNIKKELKMKETKLFYGRPFWCENVFVIASDSKIIIIDRKTLEIVTQIDLKSFGINFDSANLFYNGTYLALIDKTGELYFFAKAGSS